MFKQVFSFSFSLKSRPVQCDDNEDYDDLKQEKLSIEREKFFQEFWTLFSFALNVFNFLLLLVSSHSKETLPHR